MYTWSELQVYLNPGEVLEATPENEAVLIARAIHAERVTADAAGVAPVDVPGVVEDVPLTPEQVLADATP